MSLTSYFALLALTLALELTVVALAVRKTTRPRALLTAAALNLTTHPLGTLALTYLNLPWLIVELAILAFEAAGLASLAQLSNRRAVLVSTLANAMTMLVAVLFWS